MYTCRSLLGLRGAFGVRGFQVKVGHFFAKRLNAPHSVTARTTATATSPRRPPVVLVPNLI